jgi:hypothetical protein
MTIKTLMGISGRVLPFVFLLLFMTGCVIPDNHNSNVSNSSIMANTSVNTSIPA